MAPDIDFFIEREIQVWKALVAGDPAADRALLTDDFLGVYPTGFADASEHAAELQDGPTMADFTLSEAHLRTVSPGAVLLSYRADYVPAGGTQRASMLISSLWEQHDGRWLNSFSQDTPLASGD